MKKLALILFFIIFFKSVYGAIVSCSGKCTLQDLSTTLQNAFKEIMVIAYFFATVISIIGSLMIMFGGAIPKMYEKGRNLITKAIISLVIIMSAGMIIDILLEIFSPKLAPVK